MVCGVLAKYSIMLMPRTITTPVATKDPTSPTLYIVCPYLVSAGMWKSRGDFLLALDHCGVVIFFAFALLYSYQRHYSFHCV